VEMLLFDMFSITGVCSLHWTLDIGSGKTLWSSDFALLAVIQLFAHVGYSFVCLFQPDLITQLFIQLVKLPLNLIKLATLGLLIMDLCAHVVNITFLSNVLKDSVSAIVLFVCATMAYRYLDRGLLIHGDNLRMQLATPVVVQQIPQVSTAEKETEEENKVERTSTANNKKINH
jgi:hypothetical protein